MFRSGGHESDERAQTGPLGLLLVFAMVMAGTLLLLTVGATAIGDTQQSLELERAEKGLTQFDSQTAMVALGSSGQTSVPLSQTSNARYRVHDDAGWMNVTVTNTTTEETETIMNVTMGSVTYDDGDRAVAYQGGGVWRGDEGGSRMISPPEFHYREATLTLPLVTVAGASSIEGEAVVRRSGTGTQHFPDPSTDPDWVNPLENGRVNVTVHSQYYQAWGAFFTERTDGTAVYDHENQTVTATLVVPVGPRTVSDALAATSASGEIVMSGSGSNPARTNSYNSSQGSYADTVTDDGRIATAGDVTIKGNSMVEGNVASGGFAKVKGEGEVTGNLEYTDGVQINGGGTVHGDVEQISGIDGSGPIDSYLERRYDYILDENNNSETGAISGDTLDSGDQTLTPGYYHLDRIALSGEELTLDTGTEGERVRIAVRDYVLLENGNITVEGNGRAELYVLGQANTSGEHFYIDGNNGGGEVNVTDAQNSSQFWLYGDRDFQANIDGTSSTDPQFEGVIYAPAGDLGSSEFRIEKGDLYGGVVTGTVVMDNGGAVHYDQALVRTRVIPPDETIVRLTYLHISENPVTVTDD